MSVIGLLSLLWTLSAASHEAHAEIEVALTVDDLPRVGEYSRGESPQVVNHRLLSTFRKHGISGVVAFANAGKLSWGPEGKKVLDEWIKDGHLLANHTWSHPDLNKTSSVKYSEEISKNERELSGLYPNQFLKLFRYPFLHEGESPTKRKEIRRFLFGQGYRVAQVTIDFNDYAWNKPYLRCLKTGDQKSLAWLRETFITEALENLRGAEILSKQLFGRTIKHIALIHPFEFDSLLADTLLARWKEKGVKFIPLKEAMQDPVYEINPDQTGALWTFLNQIRKARGISNPPELQAIYDKTAETEKKLEKVCI